MSTAGMVLVGVAGVFGGALNTMAAGGGVFSFLALLLAGLPPQVAVATSQVAIPASFLSSIRHAWLNRTEYRLLRPAILAATTGTALGVWGVSQLNPATFRTIAPLFMLVAAGLLVAQPHLRRLITNRAAPAGQPGQVAGPPRRPVALVIALFGVAIYCGAFGGGGAVAILIVFGTLTSWPWHRANTTKNVVSLIMSLVGSAAFAVTGLAAWGPATLLAGSLLVGGAAGTWLASRLPAEALRKTVAVATVLGAVGLATT